MRNNVAVGLDIGTRGVHVVELTAKKGVIELTNFGSAPLPVGATGEGEVLDADVVRDVIRDLFAEMGMKTKDVWVGVANQKVLVRPIELPYMRQRDLLASLALQAGDQLTMDPSEAELDFVPTGVTGAGDDRQIRGMLVAALKTTVAGAVGVATRAGLRPRNVDLNALAILRALTVLNDPDDDRSEALIDVGAGLTDVVVHDSGVPTFVRVLPVGGMDISEALASGLGVALEEAEEIKVNYGVSDDLTDAAARIIDVQVSTFVSRVRESMQFYSSQGFDPPVRVWLSGAASLLHGMTERLEEALDIPVAHARPLGALNVVTDHWDPGQLAAVEPVLVTATGLALGALYVQGVTP